MAQFITRILIMNFGIFVYDTDDANDEKLQKTFLYDTIIS